MLAKLSTTVDEVEEVVDSTLAYSIACELILMLIFLHNLKCLELGECGKFIASHLDQSAPSL